jgi:hypothetical protein
MNLQSRQSGTGLMLFALLLAAVLVSLAAVGRGVLSGAAERERITERALAQAREALVAYAAERPIDGIVGPGYLPCPDADDDGWAESTCGSLSGHLGQAERLGRLPWKTLGLPDLRDGAGERLWYAVSTRHKGLLNCAASRECRDMSPGSALGTITVRGADGRAIQDGTIADARLASSGGAAAVVIAPGAPLVRLDGHAQSRSCTAGECDPAGRCLPDPPRRAARCDPLNYLDVAPARAGREDNAAFTDRTDARGANVDGFIQGPVAAPEGGLAVNDRIAVVGYADLMPRVLARVAHELANCLRGHAAAPVPACAPGEALGHVPDEALDGGTCNAKPADPSWWTAWRPYVLYAPGATGGLEVTDEQGRRILAGRRFAVLASALAGECLEARHACDATGCTRVALAPRSRDRHEALVTSP